MYTTGWKQSYSWITSWEFFGCDADFREGYGTVGAWQALRMACVN